MMDKKKKSASKIKQKPISAPKPEISRYKLNVLKEFNEIQYGRNVQLPHRFHENSVAKLIIKRQVENLVPCQDINSNLKKITFDRRITEIAWHPKEPYLFSAACKGGDIIVLKGSILPEGDVSFVQKFGHIRGGPGGAIFSLRFEEGNAHKLYAAGFDGIVNRWNIETKVIEHEFYNTNDYLNEWYTSMDVSQSNRTLMAGTNKGLWQLSTLDGEKCKSIKLHSGKIHYCSFNQASATPHLIVTSSGDKTVKFWDIRKMGMSIKDKDEPIPLHVLQHESLVNVAIFNPSNSSRLLTSDQKEQIRVYSGPLWTHSLTIQHPHRHFQHLTNVVPSWHPLNDVIVSGTYPIVEGYEKAPPRPLQFFDPDTGKLITEVFPPSNGIISLNIFNPHGNVLASGQGRSLIFWVSKDKDEVLNSIKSTGVPLGGKSKRSSSRPSDLTFDDENENSESSESSDKELKKPKSKKPRTNTKSKPNTKTKALNKSQTKEKEPPKKNSRGKKK